MSDDTFAPIENFNHLYDDTTKLAKPSAEEMKIEEKMDRLKKEILYLQRGLNILKRAKSQKLKSNIEELFKFLIDSISLYNYRVKPAVNEYQRIKKLSLQKSFAEDVKEFRLDYEQRYFFCKTLIDLQNKRLANSRLIRQYEVNLDQEEDSKSSLLDSLSKVRSSNNRLANQIESIITKNFSEEQISRLKNDIESTNIRSDSKWFDYVDFSCEGIYNLLHPSYFLQPFDWPYEREYFEGSNQLLGSIIIASNKLKRLIESTSPICSYCKRHRYDIYTLLNGDNTYPCYLSFKIIYPSYDLHEKCYDLY